jgi:hypothetical protein
MLESDQSFLKKYIKTYLTSDIYDLCCDFNKESKGHYDIKAVVTGGDAIFYYVNDIDSVTKDFDIKFVYSDFRDWKQYLAEIQDISKYPDTFDNNVAARLTDSYNKLSEARFGWTLEFLKKICDIEDNDFAELVLTNKDPFMLTEISPLYNAVNAGLRIINSRGKDRYKLVRINIGFEVAQIFSNFKKRSEIEAKYENIYNYLFSSYNYLENRIAVLYTAVFENERGKQEYITEGLLDGVLWCPFAFGFDEIFKVSNIIYLLDVDEPQKNMFKDRIDYNIDMDESIVTRNFSFIETQNHFCVVSIGFLIWDTVRMANRTYKKALNKTGNKGKDEERLEHHKKYVKKYTTILTALFSKIRCIEPFTNNITRCEDGEDTFDIMTQVALDELEDTILRS